ncbi:enoyl-CoA hydratase [Aromatoleum bremense]|uniref:2-(1,2-epoxy-1,2-dihydrophenyl)acetyl-CoA isomerase n=1 Tax=Aromatoleum bremense TaxID=76115 RepID=A0ABX1NYD8_9RHOO|nr:enoyl-CoA hydratase [Aromatoleum bremense]NMG17031.1 2-(1,2-epoxy-1,2-dihydrophenyl)acetyl-CoA isomerase [Aromatoleum bremense]QTQ34178.1 1,2-epoxyphenylacetyl-CoA isomerase [Aromatoleum bremense]
MEFSNITLTFDGSIARLTLNRPEKLNSLNDETNRELLAALDQVQDHGSARVLVITGAGRAFCAGQDLADPAMQAKGGKLPDIGNVVERNFKPLVMRLQNLRVPTIAAVNGVAAGGGASFALACDVVVATQSAYFLQAFSRIALSPDTGSTWFLPQRLGIARALGLAMFAEKLPAAKAAEWGLIWQALDDSEFSAGVDALAQQLAAMPTKALVRTRQAMHASTTNTLEQQLSLEACFVRELGWSEDYREGVEAFTEKRQPVFTGN